MLNSGIKKTIENIDIFEFQNVLLISVQSLSKFIKKHITKTYHKNISQKDITKTYTIVDENIV